MSWMNVTCKCGHQGDIDTFTRSAMGIDLPKAQFQCPACGAAWRVEPVGVARMTESGFVIPPKLACVPCQGVL